MGPECQPECCDIRFRIELTVSLIIIIIIIIIIVVVIIIIIIKRWFVLLKQSWTSNKGHNSQYLCV